MPLYTLENTKYESMEPNPKVLTPESERAGNAPDKVISSTKKYGETISTLKPGFDKHVEKYENVYEVEIPLEVSKICEEIYNLGGRALLVGGCVRDSVITKEFPDTHLKPKDFDLEIYGMSAEQLQLVLENTFGSKNIDIVGKAFGILKVKIDGWDEPLDFSIPRRESKTGNEHNEFAIQGDPTMRIDEASLRRDLTVNSLAYDPLSHTLYDAFNGVNDIKNKVIEVTNIEAFQEDSLRVMRIMQFASRFGFAISDRTKELCTQMVERGDLDYLPRKRIADEVTKLFTKGVMPSIGLEFAREIGFVDKYWPELGALVGVKQEKEWHPEEDAWKHTMQCVDAAADISRREIKNGNFLTNTDKSDLESLYKSTYSQTEKNLITETRLEYLKINHPELYAPYVLKFGQLSNKNSVGVLKSLMGDGVKKQRSSAEILAISKTYGEKMATYGTADFLDQLDKDGVFPNDLLNRVPEYANVEAEKRTKDAQKKLEDNFKLLVCLGALCHDLGKVTNTEVIEGAIRSFGHETAGVTPAKNLLERIYNDLNARSVSNITRKILPLVAEHMRPISLWENEVVKGQNQDGALRKLSLRLADGDPEKYPEGGSSSLYILSLVAEADQRGRNGDGDRFLSRDKVKNLDKWQSWLLDRAKELKVDENPMPPLLTGKILMADLRVKSGGPWVGVIIGAVYADQLEGTLETPEEALALARYYSSAFSRKVDSQSRDTGKPERTIWTAVKGYPDPRIFLTEQL